MNDRYADFDRRRAELMAGGAAYSPALTDFVIMIDRIAHMFIAGPEVIRAATGEVISD